MNDRLARRLRLCAAFPPVGWLAGFLVVALACGVARGAGRTSALHDFAELVTILLPVLVTIYSIAAISWAGATAASRAPHYFLGCFAAFASMYGMFVLSGEWLNANEGWIFIAGIYMALLGALIAGGLVAFVWTRRGVAWWVAVAAAMAGGAVVGPGAGVMILGL